MEPLNVRVGGRVRQAMKSDEAMTGETRPNQKLNQDDRDGWRDLMGEKQNITEEHQEKRWKEWRIKTYARQLTQQRGSTPLTQRPCQDGVTTKVKAQPHQQHQQDATARERNGEHAYVISGKCSEGNVLTVMTRRRGITPVDALTRATKWHRCAVSSTWLGPCSSSARRTTSCPLSSSSLHSKLTAKPHHWETRTRMESGNSLRRRGCWWLLKKKSATKVPLARLKWEDAKMSVRFIMQIEVDYNINMQKKCFGWCQHKILENYRNCNNTHQVAADDVEWRKTQRGKTKVIQQDGDWAISGSFLSRKLIF